ncbi:MAG: DUF1993 family protein [Rhodothalassiaceae bacterium]
MTAPPLEAPADLSLRALVLPGYAQMLHALAGQLDKAAQCPGAATFFSARLAPDMQPLSAQVRFVCLQAEEARARLLDQPIAQVAPVADFADAQDRLAWARARVSEAAADPAPVDPRRRITLTLADGLVFDLSVADYVRSWAIPQFYFHLVTAYALLRHAGAPIGKADYVPHMAAFAKPRGEST